MKYRIKIRTYGNERKTYSAQCKGFASWLGLTSLGDELTLCESEKHNMSDAMECIDKHKSGNSKVVKIEIKYV